MYSKDENGLINEVIDGKSGVKSLGDDADERYISVKTKAFTNSGCI